VGRRGAGLKGAGAPAGACGPSMSDDALELDVVWCAYSRIMDSTCGVAGLRGWVSGSECQGCGLGLGFRIQGIGFSVLGLSFKGSGFKVYS